MKGDSPFRHTQAVCEPTLAIGLRIRGQKLSNHYTTDTLCNALTWKHCWEKKKRVCSPECSVSWGLCIIILETEFSRYLQWSSIQWRSNKTNGRFVVH